MHKRVQLLMIAVLGMILGMAAHAGETVNVNEADEERLAEVLEGVGEVRAEAIVAFRDENGGFESPEDLVLVSGVGEATVEQNREAIEVR